MTNPTLHKPAELLPPLHLLRLQLSIPRHLLQLCDRAAEPLLPHHKARDCLVQGQRHLAQKHAVLAAHQGLAQRGHLLGQRLHPLLQAADPCLRCGQVRAAGLQDPLKSQSRRSAGPPSESEPKVCRTRFRVCTLVLTCIISSSKWGRYECIHGLDRFLCLLEQHNRHLNQKHPTSGCSSAPQPTVHMTVGSIPKSMTEHKVMHLAGGLPVYAMTMQHALQRAEHHNLIASPTRVPRTSAAATLPPAAACCAVFASCSISSVDL